MCYRICDLFRAMMHQVYKIMQPDFHLLIFIYLYSNVLSLSYYFTYSVKRIK